MKLLIRQRAMTLIEVLITIVVFSTGILVILAVITNGLALGNRSRNRTTATMLAKEGLELMYNLRDTNLDKAQPRSCIPIALDPCGIDVATDSNTYILTVEGSGGVKITNVDSNYEARKLYILSGGGYTNFTHTSTTQPSIFYRYITISPLDVEHEVGEEDFVDSQIKKITSTVEYGQIGGTGKVMLESFIGLTRQ